MTTYEIGKREFSKNPLKYLKMANETDVVITHRGNPSVLISKYLAAGIHHSELKHKYHSDNIDKVLKELLSD